MPKKEPLYPHVPQSRQPLFPHVPKGQQLAKKGETQPIGPESLPVAQLSEKWSTAKVRNSALALKDMEALGPDYDTEDCKQALLDYKDINRSDFDSQEEYQEARDEAWGEFLERLEDLVGEEEGTLDYLAKTEGDPLRKFCCRLCGECAPKELLEEGKFLDRISWLRSHYQAKHPGMWGKMTPMTIEEGEPIPSQYRHLVGLISKPLPKEAE